MKLYACDHCGIEMPDGPVAGFQFVEIDFQPSYTPINVRLRWQLCNPHAEELKQYLQKYEGKLNDASQDTP